MTCKIVAICQNETLMSDQNAQKIYPRSPRYVLQVKDSKLLRYASYPRHNRSFFTNIINISETGMAFTVPFLDCPKDNEIIMVEFTPPNSQPVACFAQVIRIQNYTLSEIGVSDRNCKLVAVKFMELKPEQLTMIREGLSKEFKYMQRSFRRQHYFALINQLLYTKKRRFSLFVIASLALMSLLIYLIQN